MHICMRVCAYVYTFESQKGYLITRRADRARSRRGAFFIN